MIYECGFEYDQTFLRNTLRHCLNQHSLVNSKIRTYFILISETIEKFIAEHMNDFWMLEMYIKAWKESSLKVQLNKLKDLDFPDFRNLDMIIDD